VHKINPVPQTGLFSLNRRLRILHGCEHEDPWRIEIDMEEDKPLARVPWFEHGSKVYFTIPRYSVPPDPIDTEF
jgi:hypothetical protein